MSGGSYGRWVTRLLWTAAEVHRDWEELDAEDRADIAVVIDMLRLVSDSGRPYLVTHTQSAHIIARAMERRDKYGHES